MNPLTTLVIISCVTWMTVCDSPQYDYPEEQVEKKANLCDDTEITSADRTADNVYRVFRENHYWELIGLPDRVAKVKGPFKISDKWRKYMAPVTRKISVSTVVSGPYNGVTFRFDRDRYWSWDASALQKGGGAQGYDFPGLKEGFNAVFNDGDLDKKGYPMFVAFRGIRVYYFRADREVPAPMGDKNGYVNGMKNESFPTDLTAAMAYPSVDSKVKYYVYLFKRSQYCFRPINGENGCKEWRQNSELFGCEGAGTGGQSGGSASAGGSGDSGGSGSKPNGAGVEEGTGAGGAGDGTGGGGAGDGTGGGGGGQGADKTVQKSGANHRTLTSPAFVIYFFVMYLIRKV